MDTQTIIMIAVVLLIAYVIYRNQSGSNNNMGQGNERPSYDDPNVQGRGGFGRDRGNSSNTSNSDVNQRQSSPHNDIPNVRGKGSFGRDKR